MAVVDRNDLYFVGTNLTKEEAYAASRSGGSLRRIHQGVYVRVGLNIEEVFMAYGLRICAKRYPDVALTHSSAWFKAPVGAQNALRLFVGGDYPHKSPFQGVNRDGELEEALIVQTAVWPDFTDRRLYERVRITDPKGSFLMWCATLELQVLQQMDASKVHPEKHLPDETKEQMWKMLQDKHKGRARAWDAIDAVSKLGKKPKVFEAERFFKRFYRESA